MDYPLWRLVYCSQNRIRAVDDDLDAEIRSILAVSQLNNAKAEITGALIFNDGIFAQVLEGPRNRVEEVFERIQRDDRHEEVQVLDFAPIQARTFPNWSMAFLGTSGLSGEAFRDIATSSGYDARRLLGDRVLDMMQTITLEGGRAESEPEDRRILGKR
jgi:hypothetical protein